MEKHIVELIQAEIDGENSPAESLRVASILKNDEEALSLYNDLQEISEKIKKIKSGIELPEGHSVHIRSEIAKKTKMSQ